MHILACTSRSTHVASERIELTERDRTIIKKRLGEPRISEEEFRVKMKKRFNIGR